MLAEELITNKLEKEITRLRGLLAEERPMRHKDSSAAEQDVYYGPIGGRDFKAAPDLREDSQPLPSESEVPLRDWLAGQALVGLTGSLPGAYDAKYVALRAYMFADAMLVAREVDHGS